MDKQTIMKLQETAAALVDAIEAKDLRIAELEAERPALVAKGLEAAAAVVLGVARDHDTSTAGDVGSAWWYADSIRALKARARRSRMADQWTKHMAAWKSEPFALRAVTCATFLLVHGLITDAERERIHQRMLRMKKKLDKEHAKGSTDG